MKSYGYAFLRAGTNKTSVQPVLEGFCNVIPVDQVDTFDITDLFATPHTAMMLAKIGGYKAIIISAMAEGDGVLENGRLQSVLDGLTQVNLNTEVLVLPLILGVAMDGGEESDREDVGIFFGKGQEAARTALEVTKVRSSNYAISEVLARLWPI